MVLTLIICTIVADFITGIVHWFEDTYGMPTWPLGIGKHVILPNIEHHENPTKITMSGILLRNYQTATMGIIFAFIVWYFFEWYIAWPICVTVLIAGLFGNEVHTWNHTPRSKLPKWIIFLQDTCILQTRKQHAIHHKKPYDKYYCTLTNVTNVVLELIGFWRKLEWCLAKCGLQVKRGTVDRRGF